jgi:hypothetical protein
MTQSPQISAEFLADLDAICPKVSIWNPPSAFLEDLETAYVHARTFSLPVPAVSGADLALLERDLTTWRRYYERLLHQHLAQLPGDDPLLSPVSLFATMDYGRLETAHTRALAWLLDDREHGFGFRLLEALLLHLLEGRQIRRTHVERVESEYVVDRGSASTGKGRIDILAEGRWEESGEEVSWLLVIEAKIDAEEGEEQLSQYDAWLGRYAHATEVLRVFLTPDGRSAQSAQAAWQPLSFLDLASVLCRVSGLHDKPGYHFLRYYLTGVLRDICELPVPITADCRDPYTAVDYLQKMLGISEVEVHHGRSR